MLRLKPPNAKRGDTSWRVRGTYLGQHIDRSTGAAEKAVAQKFLIRLKHEIERGALAKPDDPTWASAVDSYLDAHGDGENRYLEPLTRHFALKPLKTITQADIDRAAVALYPDNKASSRNRAVYTPVMAVMKHAGFPFLRRADGGHDTIRRPKGANGRPRVVFLQPDDAQALLTAARARAIRLQHAIADATSQQRGTAIAKADAAHRFAVLVLFLICTGARKHEAIGMLSEQFDLDRSTCVCGKTKNGNPRTIHLPPQLVAELRELAPHPVHGRYFSDVRSSLLHEVAAEGGVHIPEGIAYHIGRHTYGAWMRRYGGLDTSGLVATGAWKSHSAARIYEHVDTTEEARKADLLPLMRKQA